MNILKDKTYINDGYLLIEEEDYNIKRYLKISKIQNKLYLTAHEKGLNINEELAFKTILFKINKNDKEYSIFNNFYEKSKGIIFFDRDISSNGYSHLKIEKDNDILFLIIRIDIINSINKKNESIVIDLENSNIKHNELINMYNDLSKIVIGETLKDFSRKLLK